MKKALILIQIIFTIIFTINVIKADIERVSTYVYLNTADCTGKPNFKTKYIVEYDQNNVLLRKTTIDCNGNVWVTDYDAQGQPINSVQIGVVPTDQAITNYDFQYTEVNDKIVSWVLTASTQTSQTVYIVESMNGTVNVAYPIPPSQQGSLTSIDKELDICDGLCLKIQPIPTEDILNLSINEKSIRNFNIENCEVTIGSIDAGMILIFNNVDFANNKILSMDISKLAPGSYFVSVKDNASKKTIGTVFMKN
jgi:hypothetical protein